MELTDRQLAVRWWDRQSDKEKRDYIKNFGLRVSLDHANKNDVTKEWIWRKQQKL